MSIFERAPIIVFPSLASTNTIAHDYAIQGVADGFGVGALLQTKGYGSRKRLWYSPPGNLYTSFVVGKKLLQDFTPTLMVIAGCMSIVETFEHLSIAEDIRIKWPNDVLIAGLKVSGLMIEHNMDQDGTSLYAILGIGVNVSSFPSISEVSACCLQNFTDKTISFSALRERLQLRILENFLKMKENPEKLISHYQEILFAKGEFVNIRLPDKDIRGMLKGVDNQGALLLETPSKLIKLYSGDIIVTPSSISVLQPHHD